MKKSFLILLLIAVMMTVGCVFNDLPSVCDQLEDKSYLCEIAQKHDIRLESVGTILVVANAVAIGEGVYTSTDALQVMQSIRCVLDQPISYLFFKDKVQGLTEKYPGLLEIADIYLNEFMSTQTMFVRDREILQGWLDKRIARLEAMNN